MVVGRSCSPAGRENEKVQHTPTVPHSNGANSTGHNALQREEIPGLPGQGGIVQSGESNEACSVFCILF